MNSANATPRPSASFASRLFVMSAAGIVLFLLSGGMVHAPCWGLFFLVAIAAWPIWHDQQEYVLFQRRAVLERATKEDSAIRGWLWAGHVTRILQVLVALAWAALLLAFSVLLKTEHWLVLAADVLLLALAVDPARRYLASQVRDQQLGLLARRWPLFGLNLLFLTVGFLVIDFFVSGAPDTRGTTWHLVVEQAFGELSSTVNCPLSGLLVGLLAAAEDLIWHLSEVLIPAMPDRPIKLAAWGLLLVQAGVFAYAFARFQLGVVGLLDTRRLRLSAVIGESTFSKAFVITILVLAIPYLYATLKLQEFDPEALQGQVQETSTWSDPCQQDKAAVEALERGLDNELRNTQTTLKDKAAKQLDAEIEALFADVEQGVDTYLDWYFTLIGEYERLAALATGDLGEVMGKELERHLFENAHFGERLANASQRIAQGSEEQMSTLYERLNQQASSSLQADPCGLGGLDLSEFGEPGRDGMRASTAAGSGALVAVTSSKLLAKKTAAAVVAKVGAKKSFIAGASLLGKASVKKGGSILLSAGAATALCSPGGLLAVLCGAAAGAVTWVTVDKAFLEIDEALFREEMRSDILEVLTSHKAEISTALRNQHFSIIDGMALDVQRATERVFLPARDGW